MLNAVLLFREALYGALVIGIACGILGVWVVLRRIVFVGAALAQLSSAGIALAFWLSGFGAVAGLGRHPVALSLVVTLVGALFFGLGGGRGYVHHDATIGVAYAVAAAGGILLIAKAVVGEAHDIFLQGNILGITRSDTLVRSSDMDSRTSWYRSSVTARMRSSSAMASRSRLVATRPVTVSSRTSI